MGATGWGMYGVGTALSAYGSQRAGEKSADAMLDADDFNRKMAREEVENSYYRTALNEKSLREKGKVTKGEATLAAGSGGFATDSKSNLDVLESIDRSIELDAAIIRKTGDIEARSIQKQSEIQTKNVQDLADAKRRGGYLDSYSTMLQGGATAYQMYKG